MKNILFLGSKPIGYRCLQHIIYNRDKLKVNITGVLTNDNLRFDKSLSVKRLCEENEIQIFEKLDDILALQNIDFIISVQYHEILKKNHISVAREIAINLHMAPLPEYRGCNQFSFAIINGEKEFGTTIHRLEEGIDNGDVLFESRFPVPEKCFVNELVQFTTEKSTLLFEQSFPDIISGNYTLISQAELSKKRKTGIHYRKDINAVKQIDLSWTEDKIESHIRATLMPGFEPPYTFIGEKKIYFTFNF